MAVLRITGAYALVAGLWILLSDRLLVNWFDGGLLTVLQTVKGFFFVAATAIMLHVLITRYAATIRASEAKYRQSCETLSSYNEELMATEEELRAQFEELVSSQQRIDRQNQYLKALHEVTIGLMNNLELDNVLVSIVEKAVTLSKAQHGYLYLLNEENMCMELRVRAGLALQPLGFVQQKGEGVVGTVWQTKEPVVIENYGEWEGRLENKAFDTLKVSTGFPLVHDGKVIGAFGVNYTEQRKVGEDFIHFMSSFAELASIALCNAQMHRALSESRTKARVLIESLPDMVLRINQAGELLDYELGRDTTPRFDLRGKIGQAIKGLLPADLVELLKQYIETALQRQATQVFEYKIEDDCCPLYRETRVVPISEDEVLCIVRDITERKEMEERLRYMSLHDPATGLYDRAYFNAQLAHMTGTQHFPAGIIICDIDGLKLINDSFGQAAGDEIIDKLAAALKSCVRPQDIAARIGGDEFAVLMPKASFHAMEDIAHCIKQVTQDFEALRPEIPISISQGMSLARQPYQPLASVLKNAEDNMCREKLHRGQSVRSAIVNTLAKAMEARDFITDGHADRLQDIVELVARQAGVPEGELSDCRLLARFHDIGKVGIPDNILFKPGRLTPEEFETMKRHCEIGYRIALASPELAPIADWILKHQEWWNGEGYPLGLKGEEIPLVCRILSLADAYDAMTNDRPYRKAMSHEEAITEIRRCAGRQFDPVLAELFAAAIQEQKPPA